MGQRAGFEGDKAAGVGTAALLRVLGVFWLVAAVGLAIAWLMHDYRSALLARQESNRQAVEVAHGVIDHYAALERSGAIDLKVAQAAALAAIEKLRFGDGLRNSFWVQDLSARVLAYPSRPDLAGAPADRVVDTDGRRVFAEAAQMAAQHGDGGLVYRWQGESGSQTVDHLAHVKAFHPWGWAIGASAPVDDVQARVSREAVRLTLIVLPLGMIAMIGQFMLAARITRGSVQPAGRARRVTMALQAG